MCGIAGIVAVGGQAVDRDQLEAMGAVLGHRGPDDSGIYHTPHTGLAHRRLAIIDLSPAGHGPMCNEDGTLWVTYNGEIYNYRELIPELEALGHRFRSACDTEVILHAYEEYGERCVERFNGMFAFALWDEKRGALFCGRDRCGVKPFYYLATPRAFAFASEIKALLVLPWATRRVNEAAVYDYLVRGMVDHTDDTFFAGIRALPAGHTLLVAGTEHRLRRYWSLPEPDVTAAGESAPGDLVRLSEEFLALLEDSVRLRLRSDVAVGTCLSGGLDSSTLVCLMNRQLFPPDQAGGYLDERWHARGARQKTFSACFDDPAIDERPFIEAVIARTGAESHLVYPQGEDLFEELRRVVWHQDEPFPSTSIVAQWYVMRLARSQGVTVLLDGQGADELLCGYAGYFGPFFADLLRAGRIADLARELQLYQRYHGARWGPGLRLLAQAFRARKAWLRPQLRSRLDPGRLQPPWLADALAIHAGSRRTVPPVRSGGYLAAASNWFFARGSLPALLRYEDRNSMAHGVEARVPFLDYRLVEWVFRSPNAVRMGDGLGKRVLRRAVRGLIPEQVRIRRDKLGFNTPEAAWFRGPAREAIAQLLASPSFALHGYVRPDIAGRTFADFLAGAAVDTGLIWRWVNLELWLRAFIDRQAPGEARVPAGTMAGF